MIHHPELTNSTLDPQLVAVLQSCIDDSVLNPSASQYIMTQEDADHIEGTCVFIVPWTTEMHPWSDWGADGTIFQVYGMEEAFQIALDPHTPSLMFRSNDSVNKANHGEWNKWQRIKVDALEDVPDQA